MGGGTLPAVLSPTFSPRAHFFCATLQCLLDRVRLDAFSSSDGAHHRTLAAPFPARVDFLLPLVHAAAPTARASGVRVRGVRRCPSRAPPSPEDDVRLKGQARGLPGVLQGLFVTRADAGSAERHQNTPRVVRFGAVRDFVAGARLCEHRLTKSTIGATVSGNVASGTTRTRCASTASATRRDSVRLTARSPRARRGMVSALTLCPASVARQPCSSACRHGCAAARGPTPSARGAFRRDTHAGRNAAPSRSRAHG